MRYHTCLILITLPKGDGGWWGGRKEEMTILWSQDMADTDGIFLSTNGNPEPMVREQKKMGIHLRSAHRIQRSKRERPAEALGSNQSILEPGGSFGGGKRKRGEIRPIPRFLLAARDPLILAWAFRHE